MAVRTTIRVLLHMAKSSRIFLLPGDRGCVILAPEVGQACAPHRDDTWCASSSSRALCSAVSEEVLFRGVLQREVGIVAASAVFGLLHPLGIAYVLWAATAGAGLGALFVLTGSLAAPVAAHGIYNLLALVYLRRRSNPPEERL